MPYIVTTRRDDGPKLGWIVGAPSCSRRAVATLEEARALAFEENNRWGTALSRPAIARRLPESGGTVGPLPDGTLIEVENVPWLDFVARLVEAHPDIPPDTRVGQPILDAFNARDAA